MNGRELADASLLVPGHHRTAERALQPPALARRPNDALNQGRAPLYLSQCGPNRALVARRRGARFFELRAGIGLAQLWRDRGKRTQARDLPSPIYDWFTEGLMDLLPHVDDETLKDTGVVSAGHRLRIRSAPLDPLLK